MAVTARATRDAGHPTSWSAELDALTVGVDGTRKRLIIVSAGNVIENWESYPVENLTNEIHDPAQSWNALSVGACTFKTSLSASTYPDHHPLAPSGGLSPYSTTSSMWDARRWPIKPEIVLEGGNVARNNDGHTTDAEDLRLLSTSHDTTRAHFWPFEATSAASAQAAWMAARIQAAYPKLWPETVRGLLVHSANWTPAMLSQFCESGGKTGYKKLLRACGYGVPDLDMALSCARNSLTLIAENTIQPFVVKEKNHRATNEMHLYDLPWPVDELLSLGDTRVTLRITLSYYIEPGPGEVGWNHRYRYPSHGLRFELNGTGETRDDFVWRINKQAREEESEDEDGSDNRAIPTQGPNRHWTLGDQRNVGSIHSDIWHGTAAELATSNLIAVRPVVGWWRERHHLGKVESTTRYSLIVSIHTPSQTVDVYTPVAAKVGIPVPISIETG